MGAGKTSLGKRLAGQLNYFFLDLDEKIATDHKKTISELFELKGEKEFRNLEKIALRQTIELENTIISCGGGTPCFHRNMDWINETGCTVYLKYPAATLAHRLLHAKVKRPLLDKVSARELEGFLREMIKARETYYSEAKMVVEPLKLKANVVTEIIERLQKINAL